MATQLNNWLSIDKISGTGNAQITLTASSYTELVDRATSIKIQAQSTNAILNVRQTALVPSATLDSYEITAYGEGTYTNGITSNVPWTAVVNDNWITIDKTQGESGYTPLSITVDASTETRNGSIVFNAEGVVLTLQIYQIYDLKKAYFWIEFENTGGEVSGLSNSWTDIYYSFDANTWTAVDSTGVVSLGTNRLVYLKNETKKLFEDLDKYTSITFNSNAKIGGDLSSMTDMIGNCCGGLFHNNTYLVDASGLILPWATLADSCYSEMFQNCTSLITAPALPATTLANYCYVYMFYGCSSLTTAPELSATALAEGCYMGMFQGCTSLVNAPALPATTLAKRCYSQMFWDCTSLTTAPALPATTLIGNCYYSMFRNCTSLTTAPALPAITLADYCYSHMFYGCTSLTTAPALPATTLADNCYNSMFQNCTSLTTAPALPATTLAYSCYHSMFQGCTSLNYVKMLATDISASNCLYYWVQNVAPTGTFIKHPDANIPTGIGGIPTGWTVETATE